MSEIAKLELVQMNEPKESAQQMCTIHVCTSCRDRGTPREPQEHRPGFMLYQKLCRAFENSPLDAKVTIQPTPCLSICPRPCGFALSSKTKWTYLFGDQKPYETVAEIVQCVSYYLECKDGFMERNQRPSSLRSNILGRIPPIKVGY